MLELPASIEFTVEGNPVPAARARVMKGWTFTPKRTADAEAQVALVYQHKAQGRWFDGPVYLLCWFYLGDKRAKDLDNLAKTVLDGLTKGNAWRDDSQVKALEAYAHYDKAHPRTVVRIEAMDTDTYGNGRLTDEPFPVKVKKAKKKRAMEPAVIAWTEDSVLVYGPKKAKKNPLPKRGAKK
jgi:Holliday junction resolvase RusA-like endonuclease